MLYYDRIYVSGEIDANKSKNAWYIIISIS